MPLENDITEEEIVSLLKGKDARGMYFLYEKYSAALYGLIYRQIPITAVAEEILQQSFTNAWQYIHTFDKNRNRLYAWLLQIARKLTLAKAATIDLSAHKPVTPPVKPNTPPEDEEIDPENIGINEITATLRREQKELIDLIFFMGLNQAEAAAKLRMPLGTVKTRVRNAIMELRKLFQMA